MIHQQENDDFCSHIWTKTIKGTRQGTQKVGLEMEMYAYDAQNFSPLGTKNCALQLQDFLKRIASASPHCKIKYDQKNQLITDLFLQEGGSISIEPGGQIEFSSAPWEKFSDLITNVTHGLSLIESAANGQLIFLSHGTNPVAQPDHPLVLPKERYQIMTRYFEGAPHIRGLDMMRHTATVQANLDIFGNEHWQDAVHLVLALFPFTKNLFANSCYFKGKRSLFFSERQEIWNRMDPSRSGIPTHMAFSQNPECAYADWATKAFVFYIEGLSLPEQPAYEELTFGNWHAQGYRGIFPNISHWETHLGTLFPHLRLRDFLEIRHIDAQPYAQTLAPVAFFAALTMNAKVRKKVWMLLKKQVGDVVSFLENHEKNSASQDASCMTQDPAFFFELLDTATEVLRHRKENQASAAVAAYKDFFATKQSYWEAQSAIDFLKSHHTHSPCAEFHTHLGP
jgi:glutamate--cysteine ligase